MQSNVGFECNTDCSQRVQRARQHDSQRAGEVVEGRRIRSFRMVEGRRFRRDHRAREVRFLPTHQQGTEPHICYSSGRKIIEILKRNPEKDPKKYDEGDLSHMRKVVAYHKRHLAQEGKAKQDTNSKSYKSLKNWGHNAMKT